MLMIHFCIALDSCPTLLILTKTSELLLGNFLLMLKNYILPFFHYRIKIMNNNWENTQTSINHQTYMPSFSHKVVFSLKKPLSLFFNNPHHPFHKSPMTTLPLY